MSGDTCNTCAFWALSERADGRQDRILGEGQRECRRYPPDARGAFAVSAAHQWCGEYKATGDHIPKWARDMYG